MTDDPRSSRPLQPGGRAYPIVKAVQKRLGSRLRFVFRNFPLSNAHPHAQAADEAAEAAGAQGSSGRCTT